MENTLNIVNIPTDGYENVIRFEDVSVGLKGFIAIHNTKRGPALGGTRMWPYQNEQDALADVLRLSEGMTYKAAASDLPLGGGKAVIIGNPSQLKTPALLRAYGKVVAALNGQYITAEDMNISPDDLAYVAEETSFVVGQSHKSGNPSPWTALGVFEGIKAALTFLKKPLDFSLLKFAIQGVGETGFHLLSYLVKAGAKMIAVSDINPERIARALHNFPFIRVVDQEHILSEDVDILCPCAFGAILNPSTLPIIKAKIIAGSANNIFLNHSQDSSAFHSAGILVAPDFMINAGGLIHVSLELDEQPPHAFEPYERIGQRLLDVFNLSQEHKVSPFAASLMFVSNRL